MHVRQQVTDRLPTARSMLPQADSCAYWSGARPCHHQAPAGLQALVDASQGGVPLIKLRFRCMSCGSRRTDSVVMPNDALLVDVAG
jgi:hypothetical protein